ncbi:putative Cell division cycle-associated 7-like protein [Nannochloris sp. 'desiccata']|nr:putative Cell division cycle-associated 7-like protein [Chlorella desiccata (nom. nud.)]
MSAPFLDFFAKLQERQASVAGPIGQPLQRGEASAAATAAALAAPTSRPIPRRVGNGRNLDQDGSGQADANIPSESDVAADSPPVAARQDDPDIPWAEINAASSRIGHQLKTLRAEQDQQPFNQRESYSTEHVKRLEMFKPMNDYRRPRANKLCSKDHPQPCPYGCKTCHFCRQRTTETKTVCSMCDGVNNFYGGPARGYWCGSCLWLRIGENIDEVRNRSDWICPGCRDLCNCSGANCMRIKRGWFPTNQLSHEARDQGFRSVAHYLVHTHVSTAAAAAPIADNTSHGTRVTMTRQRPTDIAKDAELLPPGKRQRTLKFNANSARETALERASESRMQSEIAAVLGELGAGLGMRNSNTSSGNVHSNRAMSALQQLLSTAAENAGNSARSGDAQNNLYYMTGSTCPQLPINSAAVPRNSGFLGILDVDMLDDDDKTEEEPAQRHAAAGNANNNISTGGGAGGGQQSPRSYIGLARSGGFSGIEDVLPPKHPSVRNPQASHQLQEQQLLQQQQQQQKQQSSSTRTAPCAIQEVDPSVAAAAASDEYLRRLVGGLGDSIYETMHQGLPGGTDEAWFRCNNVGGAGGGRAARLVIPGWGRSRQSKHTTVNRQQQQRQRAGDNIRIDAEDHHQQQQRQQQRDREEPSEGDDDMVGATRPAHDIRQQQQQQQTNQVDIVINIESLPLSCENENGEASAPVAAAAAAAVPLSSSIPVAAPGVQPAQQQNDTVIVDSEEQHALPAVDTLPCTDAHSVLAAKVSSQSTDEFVWNQLCLRASGIVHDIHALFRHHPNSPEYAGPLLGPEADVAIYEAAYDCSFDQLKAVLRDAEVLMPDAVAVPATSTIPSTNTTIGTLCTYDGLRQAVSLLTYLARLLPEGDVRWRVERRLLGAEPFVDFSKSDVRARAILLNGMLELYATLHRRGLPIEDTAAAISSALACIAKDMHAALPLLNAIVANQPLPEHDVSIGAWQFNAEARQRRLLALFAELSVLYASLMQALTAGMQHVMAVSRAIGVKSLGFLTQELIDALLGPTAKLPGSVKKDALALVCSILDVASSSTDSPLALHMTGEERAARTAAQQKLCDIVQTSLVPALERMVQKDYPLWGDRSNRSFGTSGGLFGNRGGVVAEEEEHGHAEHVGGEKVETLARCYAVLVAHGRWSWPEVETRSTRPYSYSLFWRQANFTYRHFAVFILAHAIAHAPTVLNTPIFAVGAFKLWLQALLETGRRHCSWYLTSVLASSLTTKSFFTGVSAEQLDIRSDCTGEKRAELVGIVAKNMILDTMWKPQLAGVIGELDAVLASRKKEIETSAFDPQAALLTWESVSSRIIIALLKSLSSALAATGPGRAPAIPQLRRLLNRVATWMISSCAAAHYKHCAGSKHGAHNPHNPFLVVEEAVVAEDEGSSLKTVADARQRLQGSAFAKLPALFEILVATGAPTVLDFDVELLEPLWTVIAGCIELGSGDIEATPVDVAMFEILGDSLVPTTNESSDISNGPSTSNASLTQATQLCIYVLGTFIRRYLQRSSLRHASHECAAVNALRLIRTVLAQPAMRSNSALKSAVSVLMRPLLAALNPEGGAEASLGTKAVVYSILSELVTLHPTLLPPLQRNVNQQSNVFETALHAFWMAVCRDALSCVSSRLTPDLAEDRIRTAQLAVRAAANSAITSSAMPRLVFWPSTEQTKAQASNTLMTTLGRPRSMESVEKLYIRPGGVPGLPAALLNIANNPGIISGGTGSGLFRPGDFPWKVADAAIVFVRTLAACGGANGPSWAAACFPALHHLVPGAGQASKLLHGAYRGLRSALETAQGLEATQAYPLATAKPPVGHVVIPAAGEIAGGGQEQREPNTTTASAFSGAPPRPLPAVAQASAAVAQPQARTIASDQTLTALAALPIDSTAPVIVLLQSVASATSKDGRTAAICFIKDYSGPGGTEAIAKLAAAAPAAVAALIGLRIQPGGPLPVIRLSQVRLGKRTVRGGFTCGLTTNDSSIVEIEPQGHVADALRRTQGRSQGPAMSQEAECPAAPAGIGVHAHLQSQTTQAAAAAAPRCGEVYQVKSEQKSATPGPCRAPMLGQDALYQAHTQLVGMGFATETAKAAVGGTLAQQCMKIMTSHYKDTAHQLESSIDDGAMKGFVSDLGGSDPDPLAILAAQLGSQDDFHTSQGDVQIEDVQMEKVAEEEPGAPTTEAAPIPLMPAIEEAYKVLCTSKRIEALKSHLALLRSIPVPLMQQVEVETAPSGVAGGAVIDVAAATVGTNENEENNPPSTDHVAALMESLLKSDGEGKLCLLDHLGLSSLPLASGAIEAVVHQAAALGPWWRLRSLALSGCNIDIAHLQALIAPESQSFLWHLERLDLSYNPCLGRDVANGALRPLTQFTAPATLMMMRLWRGAPLKYLDLSYSELSSSVLAVCLRTLRSYPLTSSAGGCGAPLHDGTRPTLQCLKVGPPGDGVWTDGLIAEIAALMETAPQLSVAELCGATAKERDALAAAWQTVHEKRENSSAIQIAEIRPGVVRFAAGTATQHLLPIECTPTRHSLPGPKTPKSVAEDGNNTSGNNDNALGDLPHFLDDWNNVYGTDCGTTNEQPHRMVQDVLRPSVPRGSLLPPRRPDGNDGGERGSRPRGDGAPRRQRGGSRAVGGGGNSKRHDRLPSHPTTAADYGMTHDWESVEERPVRHPRGNDTSTHPRKKRSSGNDGGGPRPVRIYRGGNAEDELPAGGIDINSDDDGRPMNDSEEDSYYSEEENDMMDIDTNNGPGTGYYDDEEEDCEEEQRRQSGPFTTTAAAAQGRVPSSNNVAPTDEQTIEQRFKIRDGEMDVDSKLGRIYRADAKTFVKSIPDKADQKAAKAAFNLWDSCAENAWDRHRWDRPSKTQNDEPHVLGQLNKLFDLAKKYHHDLGFPFPKWVPGGGTEAFQVLKRATVPTAAVSTMPDPVPVRQQTQKLKTAATKPAPRPAGETRKERAGPRSLSLLPRNRMVDDGGRGKQSDEEESDDSDDDNDNGGFMVPDGPVSDSESEEQVEEEREVEVIDLVETGNGAVVKSGSKKKNNPFMLPESQSPVHPGAGARQNIIINNNNNNRVLIPDSDDDEDDDNAFENVPGSGANNSSGHNDNTSSAAAAREIARLSAWNWDSRKEEHPPNAAVYGLADGKRLRRQRFTAAQIGDVLGGGEEQQQQEQLRLRKPRRRSIPADGEMSEEEDKDEEAMQRQGQPVAYDSSSSDDDVPLAAHFSRYRTTPGSNEPVVDTAAGTASRMITTPPFEAAPTAENGALPTTDHEHGRKNTSGVLEQDAITPDATGAIVNKPPPLLPTDPSSAERAAALARALLGTLYKPNDTAEKQKELTMPSLVAIPRQEDHPVAYVSPAAETDQAQALAAPPSSSVAQIGIVPDSQEDDDIFIN